MTLTRFNKTFPPITLSINGQDEHLDPNEDLKIYEDDLTTEFSEQASRFAFYGGLYSDATVTLEDFKNKKKQYQAENETIIRDRILAKYGDKERITEAKMEAEFARDEQWQMFTQAIIEWSRLVGRLEVLRDAFKQRAQMLWGLGTTKRQEMMRLNPNENFEQH